MKNKTNNERDAYARQDTCFENSRIDFPYRRRKYRNLKHAHGTYVGSMMLCGAGMYDTINSDGPLSAEPRHADGNLFSSLVRALCYGIATRLGT